MSNKKKIKYRSRGRKWFIEHIPKSIYSLFNDDLLKHYREYRRYHYVIDGRLTKIEILNKELERIKTEIKNHKEKVNGEGGFKDKMLYHHSFVKHLDTNVQFDCWMELRDKSKAKKKNIKWYSYVRTVVDGKKQKKSIYCGSEKRLKEELGRLLNLDLTSRGRGLLRMELLKLTRQYTKSKTYESSWKDFMLDSHNITNMVDWGIEIGETERNKWDYKLFNFD